MLFNSLHSLYEVYIYWLHLGSNFSFMQVQLKKQGKFCHGYFGGGTQTQTKKKKKTHWLIKFQSAQPSDNLQFKFSIEVWKMAQNIEL